MEDGSVAAKKVTVKQALKAEYTKTRERITVLKELKKTSPGVYSHSLLSTLKLFGNVYNLPGPTAKLVWYCIRNTPTVAFITEPLLSDHYRSKLKLWKSRRFRKARKAAYSLRRYRRYRPKSVRRYRRFKRSFSRRRSYFPRRRFPRRRRY